MDFIRHASRGLTTTCPSSSYPLSGSRKGSRSYSVRVVEAFQVNQEMSGIDNPGIQVAHVPIAPNL
ncbi:MAG: hypothetical protein MUO68_15530 [Desulfobacteraceae bacterium]|nr:hypothetical protein [Desulfobacteraceae bacterium]